MNETQTEATSLLINDLVSCLKMTYTHVKGSQYCNVKFIFESTDLFSPDEVPDRGRKALGFFVYVCFVVFMLVCSILQSEILSVLTPLKLL